MVMPVTNLTIEMKEVECSSPSCKWKRAHHETPDKPRGIQKLWVPSAAEGPFFCSIECSLYYPREMAQAERDLKDLQADALGG